MTKAEQAAAVRAIIDILVRSGATPDEAMGIASAASVMAQLQLTVPSHDPGSTMKITPFTVDRTKQ